MVIGIEVDTSMLADPLVLAVSCSHRLVLEVGKHLCRHTFPFHGQCLVSLVFERLSINMKFGLGMPWLHV